MIDTNTVEFAARILGMPLGELTHQAQVPVPTLRARLKAGTTPGQYRLTQLTKDEYEYLLENLVKDPLFIHHAYKARQKTLLARPHIRHSVKVAQLIAKAWQPDYVYSLSDWIAIDKALIDPTSPAILLFNLWMMPQPPIQLAETIDNLQSIQEALSALLRTDTYSQYLQAVQQTKLCGGSMKMSYLFWEALFLAIDASQDLDQELYSSRQAQTRTKLIDQALEA